MASEEPVRMREEDLAGQSRRAARAEGRAEARFCGTALPNARPGCGGSPSATGTPLTRASATAAPAEGARKGGRHQAERPLAFVALDLRRLFVLITDFCLLKSQSRDSDYGGATWGWPCGAAPCPRRPASCRSAVPRAPAAQPEGLLWLQKIFGQPSFWRVMAPRRSSMTDGS